MMVLGFATLWLFLFLQIQSQQMLLYYQTSGYLFSSNDSKPYVTVYPEKSGDTFRRATRTSEPKGPVRPEVED
jgi:hypothetical protein